MQRALVSLFAPLVILGSAACEPSSLGRRRPTAELDAYCEITSTPGLVRFDGEVATICEAGSCMVARVSGSTLSPVSVSGAAMGYGVSRGRTVILHDDGRLTILDGREETELAAWAADVSVEDDRDHLVLVGLRADEAGLGEDTEDSETGAITTVPGETLVSSPSMGTRIVRLDLDTHEVVELVNDPMAGSPIAIPGSDDVLYVGAPDGVAAILRVSAGGEPRQLTNVGLTDVGQEFVPVPLHEHAFAGSRLVFSVIDPNVDTSGIEGPRPGAIWAVDVETGDAELLGEGRFPMSGGPSSSGDEVIAVVDDTPGGGCATTYGTTEGA